MQCFLLDGRFSNGNENDKQAIGLNWQNNNFALATHTFLFISLPSLHDFDDVKIAIFTVYGGRKEASTNFFFFFLNLRLAPKKQSPGNSPTFGIFSKLE